MADIEDIKETALLNSIAEILYTQIEDKHLALCKANEIMRLTGHFYIPDSSDDPCPYCDSLKDEDGGCNCVLNKVKECENKRWVDYDELSTRAGNVIFCFLRPFVGLSNIREYNITKEREISNEKLEIKVRSFTLKDLSKIFSRYDLINRRNCGKNTLLEIEKFFNNHGVKLT